MNRQEKIFIKRTGFDLKGRSDCSVHLIDQRKCQKFNPTTGLKFFFFVPVPEQVDFFKLAILFSYQVKPVSPQASLSKEPIKTHGSDEKIEYPLFCPFL